MTYKKKLIEVALPLDAINRVAPSEKNLSHGHPQTLHKWWARRPLAAARAVIWGSLVDDPSSRPEEFPTEADQDRERKRLFGILEELVKWENSNDPRILAAAQQEILKSTDGNPPPILDPFSGGGTIPLEAQRLGLKAIGGDLNPVAVLISKATVEIPPRFAGLPPVNPGAHGDTLTTWERAQGLAEDIRYYGQWMRDQAWDRIGHLYPKVSLPAEQGGGEATVIAWIWARTVKSPNPAWDGHVPLVRSWVLSKKPGKPTIWIEPQVDHANGTISYRIREGGQPIEGTVEHANGRCIATGAAIPASYIKDAGRAGEMGATPIAIVAEAKRGRSYLSLTADHEDRRLKPTWRPPGSVPERLTGGTCYGFGLTEFADLFTDRQLVALNTFSDLVADVRSAIETDAVAAGLADDGRRLRDGGSGAAAYADAMATYLAFVVDKCTDWWATITTWDSANTKLRNVFARQAIPMTWDFAEANPFSDSTGNWMAMVDWVWKVVERLPAGPPGDIAQRDAWARIDQAPPALIATDPPYYDNISYADLSDFFYVWLRRNLKEVWPEELSTLLTPKTEELIANRHRAGSKEAAFQHFEDGMERVFEKAAKRHDDRFPLSIFYAFKQTEASPDGRSSTGWETFLEGLYRTGFSIESTWPIETERRNRPVAAGTASLASSIVLVCRPRTLDAPMATRAEFLKSLQSELSYAVRLLQAESILPVDLAQSAIGPGMAVFSRYSKVVEADGSAMSVRPALALINEVLQAVLSSEETEFDADTRWALTWYEENGFAPGPYGRAETLSKAKDTSVGGVIAAGVATRKGDKVALCGPDDLAEDWDPTADSRATVWELTHHLIRRLESSESDAADLLQRVGGGYGERARQLAYLLFDIAERNGRAKEAVAYNSLIQAWPELTRLAAGPVQQTLGT